MYLLFPGSDFWDKLDEYLVYMREEAEGSKEAIDLYVLTYPFSALSDVPSMFEGLIEDDKDLHGNVEIVYQDSADIQDEVDAALAIDARITVNPNDGEELEQHGGTADDAAMDAGAEA